MGEETTLLAKLCAPIKMTRRAEQAVQMKIVKWCRNNLHPDVLVWSTNNNASTALAGARNKAMGCLAGVPDLIFNWPSGKWAFLEVKYHGKKLTAEQAEFFGVMESQGYYTGIAYGLDHMKAFADKWQLPRCVKTPVDWEGSGL